MSVHPIRSEAALRGARMLRTALGASIAAWLDDKSVVEVMLNPDGRLWIDRLGEGLIETGETLSGPDGERIIRLVAHHVGVDVHARNPRVSAELPDTGERFEGLLPPVVTAPTFAIRAPAVAIFTLTEYAQAGIMSAAQAEALAGAVADKRNILVAGATAAGKGREPVVAAGVEALDAGELGQPAAARVADQHGDEVDRLGDQRARDGDDGFLDELFEAAQRAERGAGVDRADTARMSGAPGFEEIERFAPAHFTDRDAIRPQAQ